MEEWKEYKLEDVCPCIVDCPHSTDYDALQVHLMEQPLLI